MISSSKRERDDALACCRLHLLPRAAKAGPLSRDCESAATLRMHPGTDFSMPVGR
jgi:hypothetical protein